MALCQVGQVPDATFAGVRLAGWGLGLLVVLLVALAQARRGRPNLWVAFGVGLLTVPAWVALAATAPDIARTFCAQGNLNLVIPPGQVVPAESRYDLSGHYIGSILGQLGYVGAGAILVWRGRDPQWRRPSTARIAAALRGWVPLGRGEGASFARGVALLPLLAAANVLLGILTSASGVRTGDDSHVFDNIAPLQVVLLALAAGVGEELVYRGVMQQGLKRLVPSRRGGLALGVGAQAVVFAYAHAGYQDLEHLLFAFLFALLSGVVVEALGMWAAIALHALIDFYAFTLSAQQPGWGLGALSTAVTAAVLATAAWQAWRGLQRVARRKADGG